MANTTKPRNRLGKIRTAAYRTAVAALALSTAAAFKIEFANEMANASYAPAAQVADAVSTATIHEVSQTANAVPQTITQSLRTTTAVVSETASKANDSSVSGMDAYGKIIDEVVADYSKRLGIKIPKNLIEAMILVESKGKGSDILQAFNRGDPAYGVLLNRGENTGLIDPTISLRLVGKRQTPYRNGHWDESKSNVTPEDSIRAGVCWLVHYAAKFDTKTVEHGPEETYVIKAGDTVSGILKTLHTTEDTIARYNPQIENLGSIRVGQKIKYVNAERVVYISGWQENWGTAVRAYNGGGDPKYWFKVEKALAQLDARDLLRGKSLPVSRE